MRFDEAYKRAVNFFDSENLINSDGAVALSDLDYMYLSTGKLGIQLLEYVEEIYHSEILMDIRFRKSYEQQKIAEMYLVGLLVIVEKEYYNGMRKAFEYALGEFDNNRYYRILRNVFDILQIVIDDSGRKYENFFLDILGYNRTFVSSIIRNFPTFWRHYSVLEMGIENFIKRIELDYVDKMILSDEYDELLNVYNLYAKHPRKTTTIIGSLVDFVDIREGIDSSGMLINEKYLEYLNRSSILNSFFEDSNFNYTFSKFRKLVGNLSKDTQITLPDGSSKYAEDYYNQYLGTHYVAGKQYEVVINNDIDNKFIYNTRRNEVISVTADMFIYVSEDHFKVVHPYKRVKLLKCIYWGKLLYVCFLGYPIGYEIVVDGKSVKPKTQVLFTPLVSMKWDDVLRKYVPVMKIATIRIHNKKYSHKRISLYVNGEQTDVNYYCNEKGFLGREDIYLSKLTEEFKDTSVSFELLCEDIVIAKKEVSIKNVYLFDIANKVEVTTAKYTVNRNSKLILFTRKDQEVSYAYESFNNLENYGYGSYKIKPNSLDGLQVDDHIFSFEVNNNFLRFEKDSFDVNEEISCAVYVEHVIMDKVHFVLSNNEKKLSGTIAKYIVNGLISINRIFEYEKTRISCGKWTFAMYYEGNKILESWFLIKPKAEFFARKNVYYDGEQIIGDLTIDYGDESFLNQDYFIGNARLKEEHESESDFSIFMDNYEGNIVISCDYDVYKIGFYYKGLIVHSFPHVVTLKERGNNELRIESTKSIDLELTVNGMHLIQQIEEGTNAVQIFKYIEELKEKNEVIVKIDQFEKKYELIIRPQIFKPQVTQAGRRLICTYKIEAVDCSKYIAKVVYMRNVITSGVFTEDGCLILECDLDDYNDKDLVVAAIEENGNTRALDFTKYEVVKTTYDIQDVKNWLYQEYKISSSGKSLSEQRIIRAAEEFSLKELLISKGEL